MAASKTGRHQGMTEDHRPPVDPYHLMKPNPHPIMRAAERTGVGVADCTLVGDSLADVQATHAAGATVIAYANKPHKALPFAETGADAFTNAAGAITEAFPTVSP
ncbi:Phosphoglycolate phosphatase [Streptomyces sp. enrichment culture]|uniref:HAD family hydrolase n=1 Tax=Streptomyces sp. enrichment culture TaxID=1795815 RepID=UPI003F56434D